MKTTLLIVAALFSTPAMAQESMDSLDVTFGNSAEGWDALKKKDTGAYTASRIIADPLKALLGDNTDFIDVRGTDAMITGVINLTAAPGLKMVSGAAKGLAGVGGLVGALPIAFFTADMSNGYAAATFGIEALAQAGTDVVLTPAAQVTNGGFNVVGGAIVNAADLAVDAAGLSAE